MKLYQKALLPLFVIICTTIFAGCSDKKISPESFKVEIENVFEIGDFVVKKLDITTNETQRIHIQLPSGSEDMAIFNTDMGDKFAKMTLLLVAEKITIDYKSYVLLRWPITTKGIRMSGKSTLMELLEPSDLTEEFELLLKPGEHPIGQKLDLARIHDKTYSIMVD